MNRAKFGRGEKTAIPASVRNTVTVGSGMVVSKEMSFKQVVAQESQIGATLSTVLRRVVVQPSVDRLKELESCFVAVLSFHRKAKMVLHSLMLGGLKKI